ncbi:hypothetical protein ACA910_010745 [Epithemia clementina (nom. ined.)]
MNNGSCNNSSMRGISPSRLASRSKALQLVTRSQRTWVELLSAMATILVLAATFLCGAHDCQFYFADAFSTSATAISTRPPQEFNIRFNQLPQRQPRRTRLSGKAVKVSGQPWFPLPKTGADYDDEAYEEERDEIEWQAVELAARIVNQGLGKRKSDKDDTMNNNKSSQSSRVQSLLENRFMDLACTEKGERVLENLFSGPLVEEEDNDYVLRAAIMVLQSLCIFAMQLGVKGPPELLRRMVSHLDSRRNPSLIQRDLLVKWDSDSVRRLKYQMERDAAVQLLAEVKWKRTSQGAFDLLVALGAWEVHEDIALLRSGFPLRFSKREEDSAVQLKQEAAAGTILDPETVLGIRKDLRHLKVFTIDSVSTSEIDDGLSVEKITMESETRYKLWIHIADADRYAPPGSAMFETARKRITSLYLPGRSFSMLPPLMSNEVVSLGANQDCRALSLGVEINPNGSIQESTIEIVPSLIHVTYRLTYDEVDEMLEEGTGFAEEWELGVLLDVATCRRQYRIQNGSSEGLVPNPIPYSSVAIYPDKNAPGGVGISVKVEVSHNAGRNQTFETGLAGAGANRVLGNTVPASSSFLLVTEAMIIAGESLARWQRLVEKTSDQSKQGNNSVRIPNRLRLPFRTQPKPDFLSRTREKQVMEDLFEFNIGDGLCYSWYIRRFLQPVKVTETALPHSGLGLECYVQWTSPIRRYADLQVHSEVKRFLRRQRLNELLAAGSEIPPQITFRQFGLPSDADVSRQSIKDLHFADIQLDLDINFFEGAGLVGAARTLQRQSQQYWLFEHVARLFKSDRDVTFQALVLGCVDPEKQQYAIYVYDLGLEHRYLSGGRLDVGTRMRLKIQSVYPRNNLLTFVRVS